MDMSKVGAVFVTFFFDLTMVLTVRCNLKMSKTVKKSIVFERLDVCKSDEI
jgi:hypothetical protein